VKGIAAILVRQAGQTDRHTGNQATHV